MNVKSIDAVEEWKRKLFAERLKWKMDNSGLGTHDLAAITGLFHGTISKYRTGRTLPNQINIYKLAEGLGCDPNDLMYFNYDEFTAAGFDEEQAEVLRNICMLYGGLSPSTVINAVNSLCCPDKKFTALEALIFEAQRVVKESED